MSGFLSSVIKLVSGAAAGQLVTVAAMPILTRIYTPEQFGLLALFSAILSILLSVACLRLEIAIPMPKSKSEALRLAAMAFFSALSLSFLVSVIILFFYEYILSFGRSEDFKYVLYLLPVGLIVGSTYNILTYWSMRSGAFGKIAKTKLYQSIASFVCQLLLGVTGFPVIGLLIGYVVSLGAGSASLLKDSIFYLKIQFSKFSLPDFKDTLREYSFYPKYSTLEALVNSVGTHAPMLIIAASLPPGDAGLLMLATRVMQSPMALIGNSISQVYLSKAPAEYRSGSLGNLTADVLAGLFRTGVPIILSIAILAPDLFELAFGKSWRASGVLVLWMIPWFIFQFLSSPISMVMHVLGRQKDILYLNIIGVILRVGSVLFALSLGFDLSVFYILASGLFYSICFVVFSRASGLGARDFFGIFRKAAGFFFLALVASFSLKFFLNNYV